MQSRESSLTLTKRASRSHILKTNPSSGGSSSGTNKMAFGQKAKKRMSNLSIKDMTENDYEHLCLEVTKRLINNHEEEQEMYSKLFSQTTKN
jgi:hypothetical protein